VRTRMVLSILPGQLRQRRSPSFIGEEPDGGLNG
jgi:hypothetical protein